MRHKPVWIAPLVHDAALSQLNNFVVKSRSFVGTHIDNEVWTSGVRDALIVVLNDDAVARLIRSIEHCLLSPQFFKACLGKGNGVPRGIKKAAANLYFERALAPTLRRFKEAVVVVAQLGTQASQIALQVLHLLSV